MKQSHLLASSFHKAAFGKQFFEFSFLIPRNVPTSFQVRTNNGNTASVRYILVATISQHEENDSTEPQVVDSIPEGRNALAVVKEELSVWAKGALVPANERATVLQI